VTTPHALATAVTQGELPLDAGTGRLRRCRFGRIVLSATRRRYVPLCRGYPEPCSVSAQPDRVSTPVNGSRTVGCFRNSCPEDWAV
jgi:hypothetical protein